MIGCTLLVWNKDFSVLYEEFNKLRNYSPFLKQATK